MTKATVYSDSAPGAPLQTSESMGRIAEILASAGIGYEKWPSKSLPPESDEAAIFAAYAEEIERLESRGGYKSKDVLRVAPDHPGRETLRTKFLDEHTHSDAEVRFFVEGSATFYFHVDGKVIELAATKGDLIDVPGGAKHWFDTGVTPSFTLLRFFPTAAGWEAALTGDPIARKFVAIAS